MKRIIFLLIFCPFLSFKSVPQNACYTKAGYFVATTEKYLEKAIRYTVQKDAVALQKLMDAGVVVSMKPGIKVFIEDTHVLSGTIEIRVAGYTEVFWTNIEAVKCK